MTIVWIAVILAALALLWLARAVIREEARSVDDLWLPGALAVAILALVSSVIFGVAGVINLTPSSDAVLSARGFVFPPFPILIGVACFWLAQRRRTASNDQPKELTQ